MIPTAEAKKLESLIYGVLENYFSESSIRSHTPINP